MNILERIDSYFKETGMFFLATEDGDQPKCRPLGLSAVIDGQLYFGVGGFKEVYKQLCKNPKVELAASKQADWLRVYGEAVFETDYTIADKLMEIAPFLKNIYNEETGNKLEVFHLEHATAEFRSLLSVEESYSF